MLAVLCDSFRILFCRPLLFIAIILTVWLPGNFLVNYIAYHSAAREPGFQVFKATGLIEGIFGPIYIGALIYAVARIKAGQPVGYGEAMRVGLKNWLSVLVANFVVGFFILFGAIALVVPGVLLMVRYSLMDAVIVLEGAGPKEARRRSWDLTRRMQWPIFVLGALSLIAIAAGSFLLYLPQEYVEQLDVMWVTIGVDCVVDVAWGIPQIAMVLFYLKAIGLAPASTEPVEAPGAPRPT